MYVHPEFSMLTGNLDGVIIPSSDTGKGVLDIKQA
jgi:hypothetical protein